MLNTSITPPRVPLIDPRTGLIDRAWYLFFLSLNSVANSVIDDPAIGSSSESLISSYDATLQALAQDVGTQPTPVNLSAEIIKQLEAAGLVDQSSALLSQVVELQKQLEALASQIACSCTELTAELQKQLEALASQIACPCTELTAELQKQLEALQLQPADTFGTMASQNIGISGTAALAKITALGTDGSLTFTNGIITSYVAPT